MRSPLNTPVIRFLRAKWQQIRLIRKGWYRKKRRYDLAQWAAEREDWLITAVDIGGGLLVLFLAHFGYLFAGVLLIIITSLIHRQLRQLLWDRKFQEAKEAGAAKAHRDLNRELEMQGISPPNDRRFRP